MLLSRIVETCRYLVTLCLVSLWLDTNGIAQTTIHVSADAPTVQTGIDAASNGDTVLVSPGTYNENIDFKGKAITVILRQRHSQQRGRQYSTFRH
jgi:hypothetical protein